MALKITTQIGTDLGITSEAYVRITDYQISKQGSANFRIEIYQSQADMPTTTSVYPTPVLGNVRSTARNQQIGDNLYLSLTKEVEQVIVVRKLVPIEVEEDVTTEGPLDESGNPTTIISKVTRTQMQEQDVEETVKRIVPDLSTAEDIDIFKFGYSHLKTKLEGLFGAENIVDC